MNIKAKTSLGLIGLCALYAVTAVADDISVVVSTDSSTGGDWRNTYGNCYSVVPWAPPTVFPEITVGPDFQGDNEGQYKVPGEPVKDAQCITAPSPQIAGMFDFRMFTANSPGPTPPATEPKAGHAFVWGFSGDCDYGPGCYNPVSSGTPQWNACLGASGEFYPATWDSDMREYDPLSAEVKLDKGGNGVVAFYFLSESTQCRSQKWTLSAEGHMLNGNATLTGDIINLSAGKYLVFDFSAGSGLPEGGVTLTLDTENLPETGTNCASYRELGPNSHLSGIFVNDTLACAVPDEIGCRFTGGLKDVFENNHYRAGGQAGANTALQPQPKGEWTHRQQKGPAGKFTFHGGTASAPEGSEIDVIRCSDPGGCKPSGDKPSPAKQLDFDGIGTFKNIGKKDGGRIPDFVKDEGNTVMVGHGNKNFDGTFHWFEVNIDDLGEPGNTNPNKNPGDGTEACPANGFGEKGDQELANCSCSDFYRITIYDGVKASDVTKNPDGSIDKSEMNTTDVLYEVQGYIDGGNLQLHHLTGFDLK